VYVHLIVTDNKLKLAHPITFQFIRLWFGYYVVNYSFFSSIKYILLVNFSRRYIAGSESEGHFELINKAYSM
jgi:hypothetical protein